MPDGEAEWDAIESLDTMLAALRAAEQRMLESEPEKARRDPPVESVKPYADADHVIERGESESDPVPPPPDHRANDSRSVPLVDGRSASAMFARLRLEWELGIENLTAEDPAEAPEGGAAFETADPEEAEPDEAEPEE